MESKTRQSMSSVLRNLTQEHQVALIEAALEADRNHARAARRRRITRLYLPLALAALSAFTTWFAFEYFTNGSVVGRVVDLDGRPVAGARVEIEAGSRHVLTNPDGTFQLNRVRPGEHRLTIQVPENGGTSVPVRSIGREQIDCGVVKVFVCSEE